MWRIYVILALWTQTLNAKYDVYMTNSGMESITGNNKNTFKSTTSGFIEYDYNNSGLNSSQSSAHKYNTNSRNSFGNTNVSNQNISLYDIEETSFNTPQLIENIPIVNSLPTKFPTFNNNLKPTPSLSTAWKIFTGNSFNAKLFEIMSSNAHRENLVYSPFSLQTLLAFISTMAGGKLYEELVQLLGIPDNRTYVAETFENIFKINSFNMPPTTLIMANKLYYDYRFGPIDHNVRNFAKKSFSSELEQIDFLASKKAANIINTWVSERTHNLIQNIVTPSSIAGDTSALLLNSIYFKSEWLTKFASYDTEIQDFFVTPQRPIPVDMMYNEDVFRYADFPEDLQASVVELPYKTSNLSMLLILPKDKDGLTNLEKSLIYYNFETISNKLKRELVTIKLPKFQIEFEIDMIKPLQELGLNALFNNAGNINLFKNQQKPLKVDQLKHKSFINVNEAGTEAAAATVGKYIPLSIPVNMKYFIADHPFVFVIRDSNITYFIGHVIKF